VAGSPFALAQSVGALGGFAILGPVGLKGAAFGAGLSILGSFQNNPQPTITFHMINIHV